MKIFLIAGELSGDALGGALMLGLKEMVPHIDFSGIGGPKMQAQGLVSRFDMKELSLMGLVEILPKYFHLKRRISETAQAIIEQNPDVLITIDSPDFCLRVAKLVKDRSSIRIVHYVAPSVWAWRPKRAEKMAKYVDQVLALLPFEPKYFEPVGLRCDFVGHPIATTPQPTENDVAKFKKQFATSQTCILALPGSRKSEVTRLSSIFAKSLRRVCKKVPNPQIVLPAAPHVVEIVQAQVKSWDLPVTVLDGREEGADARKKCAFAAADVALAASGTVSLELAAADTPMVIAYDMAPISRFLISRMLLIDTVTLVNLVSDTRAVPEFVGKDCDPDRIAPAVIETLRAPQAQRDAMKVTMQRLGRDGEDPGHRAARAVLDGLNV